MSCVHHFVPGRHEVRHELGLSVFLAVNLGIGSELRVRTEDEIDARAGPPRFAAFAVMSRVHILVRSLLPLRAHVEQVDEEVVRQQAGADSENAVLRLAGIRAQHAQTA